MTQDDEAEISSALRVAIRRARGYADFFGWGTNRDLEELGVLTSLAESLEKDAGLFFNEIRVRGRGNDPPDLEALDRNRHRIGFEVTELVDGEAIRAYKEGRVYDWADWTRERFIVQLSSSLAAKNSRFPKLKDVPYPGGYVVVVFTDEPGLQLATVDNYLRGHAFPGLTYVDRAFLVLSYDPKVDRCSYFELAKDG